MSPETCRKLKAFVILAILGLSEGRRVSLRVLVSAAQSGGSAFNADGVAEGGVHNGPEHKRLTTKPNVMEQTKLAFERVMDAINSEQTEVTKGEPVSLVEVVQKYIPPPAFLLRASPRMMVQPEIGSVAGSVAESSQRLLTENQRLDTRAAAAQVAAEERGRILLEKMRAESEADAMKAESGLKTRQAENAVSMETVATLAGVFMLGGIVAFFADVPGRLSSMASPLV